MSSSSINININTISENQITINCDVVNNNGYTRVIFFKDLDLIEIY